MDTKDFLLDSSIIFLNHGSFGACPLPVFQAYQSWQRRLEKQPVLFLGREYNRLLFEARHKLGAYVGASPENVAFIPNATYGVNLVAHSLALNPGDEVLATNHEYGACDFTWQYLCERKGAKYIRQQISLPLETVEEFHERLWEGVTPRTKLVFLSHITSPTAQLFPVEEVCQRARREGLLTAIDGAHAPGQLSLDLDALGADFYVGNCHKWMMSPKGAGFLYCRPELQRMIEPLVISWGTYPDEHITTGSRFIDLIQWTGTHDPAAALTVPTAIDFLHQDHWEQKALACSRLLRDCLERIEQISGIASLYAGGEADSAVTLPPQMGAAALPERYPPRQLKTRLYDEFHIEVPIIEWNSLQLIRISVQGYNTPSDIEALISALETLF